MIYRHNKNGVTWIEVNTPTEDEVRELKEEFLLSDRVANEILVPTLRAQTAVYDDYIFAIMHFPTIEGVAKGTRRTEIDFIIGKRYLITIHYESVESIADFEKLMDRSLAQSPALLRHSGHLFALFTRELYKISNRDLDKIDRNLDVIEKNIFSGKERKMVTVMSESIHKLIDFDHAIRFHDRVYSDIEKWGKKIYGETFADDMDELTDTLSTLSERQHFLREAVDEFKSTNDTLLQHKTSDVMKTLTMMSFVVFPLSLIAGIFGMNSKGMPLVGNENGFWQILIVMFIVGVIFFISFKWKKWL